MNNIPESSRKKYWFIVVLNQPCILNDTSYIIILMTYDKNKKIKTNFAII